MTYLFALLTFLPVIHQEKNTQIDYFTILNENITKYLDMGKISLCGDFNSRVGNLIDFIPNDEQNPNFDSLYVDNQYSTPRVFKDRVINILVES